MLKITFIQCRNCFVNIGLVTAGQHERFIKSWRMAVISVPDFPQITVMGFTHNNIRLQQIFIKAPRWTSTVHLGITICEIQYSNRGTGSQQMKTNEMLSESVGPTCRRLYWSFSIANLKCVRIMCSGIHAERKAEIQFGTLNQKLAWHLVAN